MRGADLCGSAQKSDVFAVNLRGAQKQALISAPGIQEFVPECLLVRARTGYAHLDPQCRGAGEEVAKAVLTTSLTSKIAGEHFASGATRSAPSVANSAHDTH